MSKTIIIVLIIIILLLQPHYGSMVNRHIVNINENDYRLHVHIGLFLSYRNRWHCTG